MPPHGIACLASYVNSCTHHHAICRDLNLELHYQMTSSAYIQRMLQRAQAEMARLESRPQLSGIDVPRYVELAKACAHGPHLVNMLATANKSLHLSERFYQDFYRQQALEVLHHAYEVISAVHFPTCIDISTFRMAHRLEQCDEVLKATCDRNNPFIQMMRPIARKLARQDVVGISIMFLTQLIPALTLARLIKTVRPECHVCCGGAALTYYCKGLPKLLRLGACVDSFIVQEGEVGLATLLNTLEAGRLDWWNVPNLIWARGGRVYRNRLSNPIPLDRTPTVDYSVFKLRKYPVPEPIVPLATSRGCYWRRCAFCTQDLTVQKCRVRPIAQVVDDMEAIFRSSGARYFYFSDEAIHPARMRELARLLIERGLMLKWSCDARFDRGLDDETIALIAKSGCIKLWFGLETTSDRLLLKMNKGTTVAWAIKVLKQCSHHGIAVHLFTMLGFPTERKEEARDLVRFLHRQAAKLDTVSLSEFHLHPFSDVARNPSHYGLTKWWCHEGADVPLLLEYEEDCDRNYVRQIRRGFFSTATGRRLGGGNEVSKSHLLLLCNRPPQMGSTTLQGLRSTTEGPVPSEVRWVRLRFWSDSIDMSIRSWMGVTSPLGDYCCMCGPAPRIQDRRVYAVNARNGRCFVLAGALADAFESLAQGEKTLSRVPCQAHLDRLQRLHLILPAKARQ